MAREFRFIQPKSAEHQVDLDRDSGSIYFSNGAEVDAYRFDDDSLNLKIDDWWFDKEGIEELINFLTIAKERLA